MEKVKHVKKTAGSYLRSGQFQIPPVSTLLLSQLVLLLLSGLFDKDRVKNFSPIPYLRTFN